MNDSVVVIGAGIVGAACAANLVLAGKKVTIVDRVAPGEACSYGNAGGLSPGISFPLATPGMFKHIPGWLLDADSPLVVAWKRVPAAAPWLMKFLQAGTRRRSDAAAQGMRTMMRGAFEDYAPLFEFSGAQSLIHRVGQLYVFSTDEAFREERLAIAIRRSLGIEQLLLDGNQVREIEPDLAPMFRHGIYFPAHGHCSNPQRLVQLLIEACVKNGARFVSADVTHIARTAQWVGVHTSAGTLSAERVVVAGGIWSNDLIRPLGWRVPLESHRGYHIQVADAGINPTRNVQWMEKKTLVTPMDAGLRVAGTAEIAGTALPPNRRRLELLSQTVRKIYPGVQFGEVSEWMGHRPCTPDSLPIIGPLPDAPNVICAFGHGHVGLTSASFTGRVVAEMISGKAAQQRCAAFSIERFCKR